MAWIVGIDLRGPGSGALHDVSGPARHHDAREGGRADGAHALDPDMLRHRLRLRQLDEVVCGSALAALAAFDRVGVSPCVVEVLVLIGARAEGGLAIARMARPLPCRGAPRATPARS